MEEKKEPANTPFSFFGNTSYSGTGDKKSEINSSQGSKLFSGTGVGGMAPFATQPVDFGKGLFQGNDQMKLTSSIFAPKENTKLEDTEAKKTSVIFDPSSKGKNIFSLPSGGDPKKGNEGVEIKKTLVPMFNIAHRKDTVKQGELFAQSPLDTSHSPIFSAGGMGTNTEEKKEVKKQANFLSISPFGSAPLAKKSEEPMEDSTFTAPKGLFALSPELEIAFPSGSKIVSKKLLQYNKEERDLVETFSKLFEKMHSDLKSWAEGENMEGEVTTEDIIIESCGSYIEAISEAIKKSSNKDLIGLLIEMKLVLYTTMIFQMRPSSFIDPIKLSRMLQQHPNCSRYWLEAQMLKENHPKEYIQFLNKNTTSLFYEGLSTGNYKLCLKLIKKTSLFQEHDGLILELEKILKDLINTQMLFLKRVDESLFLAHCKQNQDVARRIQARLAPEIVSAGSLYSLLFYSFSLIAGDENSAKKVCEGNWLRYLSCYVLYQNPNPNPIQISIVFSHLGKIQGLEKKTKIDERFH